MFKFIDYLLLIAVSTYHRFPAENIKNLKADTEVNNYAIHTHGLSSILYRCRWCVWLEQRGQWRCEPTAQQTYSCCSGTTWWKTAVDDQRIPLRLSQYLCPCQQLPVPRPTSQSGMTTSFQLQRRPPTVALKILVGHHLMRRKCPIERRRALLVGSVNDLRIWCYWRLSPDHLYVCSCLNKTPPARGYPELTIDCNKWK